MFAHQQGDYPFAVERYEEGLAMRRALGDRRGIASSLNNLGVAAQERGDLPRARLLYEEALALMRELGDRHAVASVLSKPPRLAELRQALVQCLGVAAEED